MLILYTIGKMTKLLERLLGYGKALGDHIKGYRRLFLLNTGLGFISAVLGSIGIGAIIPLFYIISNKENPALDSVTKVITDTFHFLHIPLKPSLLLAFIILLFFGKAIVTFIAKYVSEKMSTHYTETMRKIIFKRSIYSSWGYLLNQKTSSLERTIMDDTEKAGQVMTEITNILLALTNIITYGVVAFTVSPMAALLTLPAGALIFVFFRRFFGIVRRLVEIVIKTERKTTHYILEHLAGVKSVKAAGVEEQVVKNAWHYFEDLTKTRIKFVIYDQTTALSFEPMSVVIVAGLFFISYHAPNFNIAAFAATIYLVQKIFSFIQILQSRVQILNKILPNLAEVNRVRAAQVAAEDAVSGDRPFVFDHALSLENVSFAHIEGKKVLHDVNLKIKKGEWIGLIGKSGSGKTTIADLLLRLYAPLQGAILLDGVNTNEVKLNDWRSNIAYVAQDAFLLDDTVANNIRFYDESLTSEDIETAAKRAHIYDTIEELPNGFDTIVGERGMKISGGQKQRIAIARALARKPKILILDEATSALDNESEKLVQETIQGIKGSVTIISIAHRLSTLSHADTLVALEDGKIIEQGSPKELLANKDSYFHRMSTLDR